MSIIKNWKTFNEGSSNKVDVYIVDGMYNDDIDGITGNPYLKQLVTTNLDEAIKYYDSVTLKSEFIDINDNTKVIDVVEYVSGYENFELDSKECYMDITLDKCSISASLYYESIDGWRVREYADYRCDTIKEKKLFFDGTVGTF